MLRSKELKGSSINHAEYIPTGYVLKNLQRNIVNYKTYDDILVKYKGESAEVR